nr:adherens junction-associated protein 1 [Anser cygnoides]
MRRALLRGLPESLEALSLGSSFGLSPGRSGCPLGSHAWMLIAMFHLAMDLASCEPVGVRLSPRPAHRHRLPRGALWGMGGGEEPRRPVPPCPSRPSTAEPAAGHSSGGKDARPPRGLGDTSGRWQAATRCVPGEGARCSSRGGGQRKTPKRALLTSSIWRKFGVALKHFAFRARSSGCAVHRALWGGLAVHQIITITVSLIMVIAALITTLVLKNCCAQSGTTRRNSHQRKINQQEESCQNLTDFTPARVPSSLDIFTAYNETLQCSHECVRTPVPVYTEEALHSPGDYKATYNGNRPSSSDRHLIPVAFVSEKWFEISC